MTCPNQQSIGQQISEPVYLGLTTLCQISTAWKNQIGKWHSSSTEKITSCRGQFRSLLSCFLISIDWGHGGWTGFPRACARFLQVQTKFCCSCKIGERYASIHCLKDALPCSCLPLNSLVLGKNCYIDPLGFICWLYW